MSIRPIETKYRGCRFRSRLEARWAVYFDALGIEWEYELEGFVLDDNTCYLPDFWLSQVRMWAEVKPVGLSFGDRGKCQRLANESDHPVLMLIGTPSPRSYWAIGGNIDGEDDLCDYIIDRSCLEENRFFGGTGATYPEHMDLTEYIGFYEIDHAINRSRSARFEHGESP